jgi:hypothetical protein
VPGDGIEPSRPVTDGVLSSGHHLSNTARSKSFQSLANLGAARSYPSLSVLPSPFSHESAMSFLDVLPACSPPLLKAVRGRIELRRERLRKMSPGTSALPLEKVLASGSTIASGWSEPVPGRELHPLKSSAFHVADRTRRIK